MFSGYKAKTGRIYLPVFALSHLVGMAMVQVWCMRMVMRQPLVLMWVGMDSVRQWRIR
jgi:hypothetical protein